MNIPINQGYITTTYDKIVKILGEPEYNNSLNSNKITVEWNFYVNGYYVYAYTDSIQICEWYIGDKNVDRLYKLKINKSIEDLISQSFENDIRPKRRVSMDFSPAKNADKVIKSLLYISD